MIVVIAERFLLQIAGVVLTYEFVVLQIKRYDEVTETLDENLTEN